MSREKVIITVNNLHVDKRASMLPPSSVGEPLSAARPDADNTNPRALTKVSRLSVAERLSLSSCFTCGWREASLRILQSSQYSTHAGFRQKIRRHSRQLDVGRYLRCNCLAQRQRNHQRSEKENATRAKINFLFQNQDNIPETKRYK